MEECKVLDKRKVNAEAEAGGGRGKRRVKFLISSMERKGIRTGRGEMDVGWGAEGTGGSRVGWIPHCAMIRGSLMKSLTDFCLNATPSALVGLWSASWKGGLADPCAQQNSVGFGAQPVARTMLVFYRFQVVRHPAIRIQLVEANERGPDAPSIIMFSQVK